MVHRIVYQCKVCGHTDVEIIEVDIDISTAAIISAISFIFGFLYCFYMFQFY